MSHKSFSLSFQEKAELTKQGMPLFAEDVGMLQKGVKFDDIPETTAQERLGGLVIDYLSSMSKSHNVKINS